MPQNGNGFVGIGTSTPTAPFELTKTYNSATGSQTNFGSNINITNTGAVAVGPDVTYGQKISLSRSGASAEAEYSHLVNISMLQPQEELTSNTVHTFTSQEENSIMQSTQQLSQTLTAVA